MNLCLGTVETVPTEGSCRALFPKKGRTHMRHSLLITFVAVAACKCGGGTNALTDPTNAGIVPTVDASTPVATCDSSERPTDFRWKPSAIACITGNSTTCDDGNPCTHNDGCGNGECTGSWDMYCIPCRTDADCCGGPVFCPAQGREEVAPNGKCGADGTCGQRTRECPNGCTVYQGCNP